MQSLAPDSSAGKLDDTASNLPQWQQLPTPEQRQLLALMQDPEAVSQLLALQQAWTSANRANVYNLPVKQDAFSAPAPDQTISTDGQRVADRQRQQQALVNAEGFGLVLPSNLANNRQLPSPPQFDRSLLQGPFPAWTAAAPSGEASLLAARTSALHAAHVHQQRQPAPFAEFGPDMFRCSSMGAAFLGGSTPAELSLRASSMPGTYQDIAARLQLNRAGINTTTASMIPVISQDWLVIPFGTAQQLLPAYPGEASKSDGEAIMLVDENGRNWPVKFQYSRHDGSLQLSEGWKAFAQSWNLGHGEQLQLSRRCVSTNCIWLDARIVNSLTMSQNGRQEDSLKQGELHSSLDIAAAVPLWQQQLAASRQGPSQPPPDHLQALPELSGAVRSHPVHQPAGPSAAKRPIISVQRVISCPTYCSRLHVNQHMAEHLLPLLPESQNVKPPLSYTYQSLFKHKVNIIDELGEVWIVQYEGFVSAAQRHYRFTAGWTNLVKQKGIRVGDAVVLERWTEDRTKLHLHVIKGKAQDLPAAPAQGSKAKVSKRTARPAQRAKHNRLSVNTVAQQPSSHGYSPSPGHSGALDALYDAALLCANTSGSSPNPDRVKSGLGRSESASIHGVPAAAVAAADAAALSLDGSKLAQAAGLSALQQAVGHKTGFLPFDSSKDRQGGLVAMRRGL